MYASTDPKTKEELIRQVEAGEATYIRRNDGFPIGNGRQIVEGDQWAAIVEVKGGQIVRVLS